jgi:hypothetical protein
VLSRATHLSFFSCPFLGGAALDQALPSCFMA